MRRKSILDRLCVKILLDHERYLKHDGVVEFPQVEAGELLYLLKSVDKSVSVDKELPRGLGDVEVILKETLDGEKSLVVKALDGSSLEHLSEEHIAQSGGQLIDEACNAEIVIADDGLLGVEYLADLKGYLSLFEGAGKILYSLDGGAYADKHMSVKLGAQRIRDGACELLKILRLDIIFDFLNYCNVMLVDVDNEVLGLVGEEILHGVEYGGVIVVGYPDEQDYPRSLRIEAQLPRLEIDIAGKDIIKDNILYEVAPVELLLIILLEVLERDAADSRKSARKLVRPLNEYSVLGLDMGAEVAEGAAVDIVELVIRKHVCGGRNDLTDLAQLATGNDRSGFVNHAQSPADCVTHLMNKTLKNSV